MDCEPEEIQFLGIVGIYRESWKLIASWRRLFSQIAASFIVPLSFLFLLHIQISHLLFSQIRRNESALKFTASGSQRETLLLHRLYSEWSSFLLFKSFYLVALLVLSLFSTAATVYTIASTFTAKHDLLLSFPKVLSIVPKVWRRLAFTFLSAFLILLAYNLLAVLALVLVVLLVGSERRTALFVLISFLAVAYLAGLIWISIVWHVASVVSVLEDDCGLGAMRRSRNLVRGKTLLAAAVFVQINLAFVGIELAFRAFSVAGKGSLAARIGFAAAMLLLLSAVVLLALVAQTVVYFVCKSFHHQSIDKSALADHLEVFLGEYVPLKANASSKDVQMEGFRV